MSNSKMNENKISSTKKYYIDFNDIKNWSSKSSVKDWCNANKKKLYDIIDKTCNNDKLNESKFVKELKKYFNENGLDKLVENLNSKIAFIEEPSKYTIVEKIKHNLKFKMIKNDFDRYVSSYNTKISNMTEDIDMRLMCYHHFKKWLKSIYDKIQKEMIKNKKKCKKNNNVDEIKKIEHDKNQSKLDKYNKIIEESDEDEDNDEYALQNIKIGKINEKMKISDENNNIKDKNENEKRKIEPNIEPNIECAIESKIEPSIESKIESDIEPSTNDKSNEKLNIGIESDEELKLLLVKLKYILSDINKVNYDRKNRWNTMYYITLENLYRHRTSDKLNIYKSIEETRIFKKSTNDTFYLYKDENDRNFNIGKMIEYYENEKNKIIEECKMSKDKMEEDETNIHKKLSKYFLTIINNKKLIDDISDKFKIPIDSNDPNDTNNILQIINRIIFAEEYSNDIAQYLTCKEEKYNSDIKNKYLIYHRFIKNILCNENDIRYKILCFIQFYKLKDPEFHPPFLTFIFGEKGIGKSQNIEIISKLYGKRSCDLSTGLSELLKQFNGPVLKDKDIITIDDFSPEEVNKNFNKWIDEVKTSITMKKKLVENKRVDKEWIETRSVIIAACNQNEPKYYAMKLMLGKSDQRRFYLTSINKKIHDKSIKKSSEVETSKKFGEIVMHKLVDDEIFLDYLYYKSISENYVQMIKDIVLSEDFKKVMQKNKDRKVDIKFPIETLNETWWKNELIVNDIKIENSWIEKFIIEHVKNDKKLDIRYNENDNVRKIFYESLSKNYNDINNIDENDPNIKMIYMKAKLENKFNHMMRKEELNIKETNMQNDKENNIKPNETYIENKIKHHDSVSSIFISTMRQYIEMEKNHHYNEAKQDIENYLNSCESNKEDMDKLDKTSKKLLLDTGEVNKSKIESIIKIRELSNINNSKKKNKTYRLNFIEKYFKNVREDSKHMEFNTRRLEESEKTILEFKKFENLITWLYKLSIEQKYPKLITFSDTYHSFHTKHGLDVGRESNKTIHSELSSFYDPARDLSNKTAKTTWIQTIPYDVLKETYVSFTKLRIIYRNNGEEYLDYLYDENTLKPIINKLCSVRYQYLDKPGKKQIKLYLYNREKKTFELKSHIKYIGLDNHNLFMKKLIIFYDKELKIKKIEFDRIENLLKEVKLDNEEKEHVEIKLKFMKNILESLYEKRENIEKILKKYDEYYKEFLNLKIKSSEINKIEHDISFEDDYIKRNDMEKNTNIYGMSENEYNYYIKKIETKPISFSIYQIYDNGKYLLGNENVDELIEKWVKKKNEISTTSKYKSKIKNMKMNMNVNSKKRKRDETNETNYTKKNKKIIKLEENKNLNIKVEVKKEN